MRFLVVALVVGLAAWGGSEVDARVSATGGEVAIFYYAWYGTPARDGGWQHWAQAGAVPPGRLASAYYPVRGPYSSSDAAVVAAQMREIAAAGIDTLIVSWWGAGSREDLRLPQIATAARRVGLRVAVHLEPWEGRTPASTADAIRLLSGQRIRDFYVYDSTTSGDEEWATALAPLTGVRVFANTWLPGRAAKGGFDGLYSYDVLVYDGGSFARVCASAHRLGLLCAPSVGPGFDGVRATPVKTTAPRRDGRRYDGMWRSAVKARPEIVTVTSYNEWHEGTQIEPARGSLPGYRSYEGAYGLFGRPAETAYLARTAVWAGRLDAALRQR
jgi:hypothetical protein